MAITSNFEYKGTKYKEVIFKIFRVFGSKREGWNAVFAFAIPGDPFEEVYFKGLISVGMEWVDSNPYPELYKKMEQIIVAGGFTIRPEAVAPVVELVVEVTPAAIVEVVEPKPKKTKTKKVAKNGVAPSN